MNEHTLTKKINEINELDAMPGLSLEEISELKGLDFDADEGVLMFDAVIFADDGNCEVAYPGHTRKQAAQKYVSNGEWGEKQSTVWITLWTYKKGIALDNSGFAEERRYEFTNHKIAVEPEAPKCTEAEHDWRAPYSVVGGLKENPGVFGHGGGAISKECCSHCGRYRITDNWAQDPTDGQQGLDSTSYLDADEASLRYVMSRTTGD